MTIDERDIACGCVDFDGTCRGGLIFNNPDDLELSMPRCRRHYLFHRMKRKQELKTL